MNDHQLATICSYIASNWPAGAMTKGTLDVYALELGSLNYDETLAALRDDFADEQFPPTPMRLRNAVLRRREPDPPDIHALIDELLERIASVGYAQPEPEWSSPILTEWVERRGGWVETCASTPARAAVDARGMSAFSTWRAQCRDDLRTLVGREDHAVIRNALTGNVLEIERPGSRFGEDDG